MDELIKEILAKLQSHHTLPNYYLVQVGYQYLQPSNKPCILICLKDKRLKSISKKPSMVFFYYPSTGKIKCKRVEDLSLNAKVVNVLVRDLLSEFDNSKVTKSNIFSRLSLRKDSKQKEKEGM